MTTIEFTTDQLKEIEEGRKAGIDVSVYENPGYLAIQMHEIRLGLLENLPVDIYAHPVPPVWPEDLAVGRDVVTGFRWKKSEKVWKERST